MIVISPWLLAHKLRRAIRGTDPADRDTGRWFGKTYLRDEAQGLIRKTKRFVIAGANYGELLLMERLTEILKTDHPEAEIVWMLRDGDLLEDIRKSHPEQSLCLWPFDFVLPVANFLDTVKPDVLIVTERFRFTNLICGAHRYGARVVLLNGRFKPLHFFAKPFQAIYRWNLNCIDLAVMQSEKHAERARKYSDRPQDIRVVSDLKEYLSVERSSAVVPNELEAWLTGAHSVPVLIAGSTDGPEEEAFVLESFRRVRATHNCRLIIAPRKVKRSQEVAHEVEATGLSYGLRSQKQSEADVLILDTLGELAYTYRVASSSYVGGFFDGMGHNILEPVVCGSPVAYGKREGHFGELQERCESLGVGFRVGSVEDLTAHWNEMLDQPELRDSIEESAARLRAELESSWSKVVEQLESVIPQEKVEKANEALRDSGLRPVRLF